jgi:L-2-hydroxyglutarate oxidase
MQQFDYVIIGGGIVGLSTAWTLVQRNPRAKIAVLEKGNDWAEHQTGRNSGVIHSGIYYKPGSLKATLCREGSRHLREFCDVHGVRYEICGKVIVATESTEIAKLHLLYDRGIANGLLVKKMSASEVGELEPHVRCLEGVHVPCTGIVGYSAVSRKLAELIALRGGDLRLKTKVNGFRKNRGETIVETSNGPLNARWIINCAGLHSDRLAKIAGANPFAKIIPFRGEYFELSKNSRRLVKNLIYPVPDPEFPFLGVHFTRMIDGSVHAGPNAVLSFKREGYSSFSFNLWDCIDTLSFPGFWRLAAKHLGAGLEEFHRSFSKAAFLRSLQKLIPEIREEDLVPAKAGVRAQALLRDGKLVDDFMIVNSGNVFHVCNAPSPAATASLEIGRYIVDQIPGNIS